jgi:hypothetical protein
MNNLPGLNLQNFGDVGVHHSNVGLSQRRLQTHFVSANVQNNAGLTAIHQFATFVDAANLQVNQYVLVESNPTGQNPTIQHLSIPGNFGLSPLRVVNNQDNVITLRRINNCLCDDASFVAAHADAQTCYGNAETNLYFPIPAVAEGQAPARFLRASMALYDHIHNNDPAVQILLPAPMALGAPVLAHQALAMDPNLQMVQQMLQNQQIGIAQGKSTVTKDLNHRPG